MVLDVESLSDHPLARSIARDLKDEYKAENNNRSSSMQSIQGKGVMANYNGGRICIGNEQLMKEEGIHISREVQDQIDQLQKEGQTIMFVGYEKRRSAC